MFNTENRKKNILRISFISTITSMINLVLRFLYRTVFICILSKEYLGIEGLFSNVISVLAIAELGFGTVIAYKLYEPIKFSNIYKTAALMGYYKKIYEFIAIAVALIGTGLSIFLPFLIKDASEIPKDVNLYIIYFLFLLQSVSSYFFTYKQTLLIADQKGDLVAIYNSINSAFKMILQLIVLKALKNYQSMLIFGIGFNILMNYIFSLYITNRYKEIFMNKCDIDIADKKDIYIGVKAMLFHNIGGALVGSTDNIILSAFVGLGQLGRYSNYSLITTCIKNIFSQFLGNFTASLGNAYLSGNTSENYNIYKKLLIIDFTLSNLITVCLYVLINPFILLWQGEDMILDQKVVIVITIQFFINIIRIINMSYTNACGLFKKDLLRPVIEVVINLIISIVLSIKLGMIGVFIGTIASYLCTVFWREPYLLYKYIFFKNLKEYWILYSKNCIFTIVECYIVSRYFIIEINDFKNLILQFGITILVSAIVINIINIKEIKWIIDLIHKIYRKKGL